jgi:predicted nucleotidyltransferase
MLIRMAKAHSTDAGCGEGVEGQRAAISALCRRFGVRRLDLFGSTTGDRFDPERSDIDLPVEFEPTVAAGYADAYFGLREALSALFGREVDLVTAPALKNPYLRRRILSERRTLFTPVQRCAGRRAPPGPIRPG